MAIDERVSPGRTVYEKSNSPPREANVAREFCDEATADSRPANDDTNSLSASPPEANADPPERAPAAEVDGAVMWSPGW
ncbi:MAG TPA: hypothetical protein VGH76_04670 [Actinomycetospora sp.]|uniref:hypothetical protein n=1 Tax=Actinomycetospora sp. TaxID=1872135 RepID=UPI002F3F2725